MKDNLRIALTFSGGGYRAATFHLGALSYLHSVKVGEFTLLDHVVALSTISGGTITGLRYMLGLSRGESVTDIFKELYTFLTDVELATVAMNNLASYDKGQCASLIRTMADIYNKELFKGAVLGDLMDQLDDIHICHFAANATDFTNGLAFRFQVTEKTGARQEQATGYGLIGNNKIRIPREVARHIRLSEVLACSSCFPSGFEPLVFPKDFVLGDSEEVKKFIAKTEPFGIMDGGIVDNQGIEPILLAEQRMETSLGCKDGKCLDLIIVSDVASPYMSAYQPSDVHLPKGLNRMTLKKLTASIWGVGIGLTVATALSLVFTQAPPMRKGRWISCDSTFLGIYLHFFLVRCIGGCMGPGCGYSDYIYSHEEKADFCGCKVSHSGQYSGSNESSLWGYCHIAGKSGEFRIAFGVFCLYEAFAPDGL